MKRRKEHDMKFTLRGVCVVAAVALVVPALAAARLSGDLGAGDSPAAAKSATAKFTSLAVAKKAGYGLLKDKQGIACIAMDPMPGMQMGAMGVHYANSTLVGDGKLNATTPEALVYEPLAGGKLRLAALEYVVLKAAWAKGHRFAPALFGHSFSLTPAGNRFGLPAFYSLHVWLFKHNPSGEFAMWNPAVSCPGGGR
ncbi:MAG: hypothetical protein ACXVRJ_03625 [Gaiellaceae bacterium]